MTQIQKLLGTDAWLTLILGAAFVAAFLVAVLLLSMGAKGRKRRSLTNLMLGRGKDVASEPTWMPAGLTQAGERFAEAGGFSSRLDAKLEQAGLPMKAGEFVALTAVCAVAGGVLGAFLLANIIFVLMVAVVASLIPYVWLVRARSQRQRGHAVGRHGREHPTASGRKPGGGARHRGHYRSRARLRPPTGEGPVGRGADLDRDPVRSALRHLLLPCARESRLHRFAVHTHDGPHHVDRRRGPYGIGHLRDDKDREDRCLTIRYGSRSRSSERS